MTDHITSQTNPWWVPSVDTQPGDVASQVVGPVLDPADDEGTIGVRLEDVATAVGVELVGHGSLQGVVLRGPIVGVTATPSGNGYWLGASNGGIFSFGDGDFHRAGA